MGILSGFLSMKAIINSSPSDGKIQWINTARFMTGEQSNITGASRPTVLSYPLGIYQNTLNWWRGLSNITLYNPTMASHWLSLSLLCAESLLHSSYAPSVNTHTRMRQHQRSLMKYRGYAISWLMVCSADYALDVAPITANRILMRSKHSKNPGNNTQIM